MENKQRLRFFILFVITIVLLAFVTTSSQGASQRPEIELSQNNQPNGGGGDIGGYPIYDSGWHELGVRPDDIAVQFNHNIGGDPDIYLVKLECRDDTELSTYDCDSQGFTADAHWYGLTSSVISVFVRGGARPDYIRVRIYIELPAYDSGWDDLGTRPDPISVLYTHNLSGDADQYLVNITCEYNSVELGIYDCVSNNFTVDANWFALTNMTVNVWAQSLRPDAVRVRIYVKPSPSFDSGWDEIGIRPDPLPLPYHHKLGGDPDLYFVDLACRDDTTLQTYQCGDAGFSVNAHWFALTDSSITVFVVGGTRPDYVRVRIWTTSSLFLPLISQK